MEDLTAHELATALDQVQDMNLAFTGPMSMLDEAVSRWTRRHPVLVEAHRRYAEAWRRVRRDDTPQQQQVVRQAAAELATLLRGFGGERLALCQERAGWGRCNLVLDDEGRCPAPHVHRNPEDGGTC
ncbi:MAG TPA: hypothetical protein VGW74_06375 [Propionibacteriaceae bacterium]|nr:hypothetical protein [Propionibacteriaceae bacterium]